MQEIQAYADKVLGENASSDPFEVWRKNTICSCLVAAEKAAEVHCIVGAA